MVSVATKSDHGKDLGRSSAICESVYAPAVDDRIVVTAWVHAQIEDARSRSPRPTYATIGKSLGCSGPNVANILHFKSGVGRDIETHIADSRFAGSVDRLRAHAREWWAKGGERSPSAVGILDARIGAGPVGMYPSLAELVAESPAGTFTDEAVAIFRAFRFLRGDPGKEWFRRRLRDASRVLQDAIDELPPGAKELPPAPPEQFERRWDQATKKVAKKKTGAKPGK
jgi:hypothetical protein